MVDRGDGGKPIRKGEATREEYVLGLIRLETCPDFPASALEALTAHQADIAQDNCKLPWPIVRRYSEEVFTRIADGRIPRGWQNEVAISNVRLETIAMSSIQTTEPAHTHSKHSKDPRNPYIKDTMGTPCTVWNRDPDACDKAAKGETHGEPPQKYAHICGYCANVRQISAAHPEQRCYSKKASEKVQTIPKPRIFNTRTSVLRV